MKSPLFDRVCRSIARCNSAIVVVMMSLLMTLCTSEVLAQSEPLRPPTTKEAPSGPKFIMMGIALVLTGLVIVVAILKSKRGHQD
jgi:hypothetical protein